MQELLTGKKRLPGFSGKWEVKKLGDIGECIIGLTYKPENVKESGLLVLRSSNIADNQLKFDDTVFVDVEVTDKLMTKEGDILICVRNGSRQLIGKNALIDKKSEGLTFGAFMSVYRTKFYKYIFHAFQTNEIKKQIHENIGATINQITNKNLNSFEISLPPQIEEQKAIAEILTDIDKEIEALEKNRDKYKALKQGMMQELLTGKTRIIDN
jgi:type I restriction enzyme S subunit